MEKRRTSGFIPYKIVDGKYYFFVQLRSKDASVRSNWFGLFGGGIEGKETPEEALEREIKEELDIEIIGYKFLKVYVSPFSISSIFYLEVSTDFESTVTILEGQYGRFFTLNEINDLQNMTNDIKEIISDLDNKLES